MLIDSSDLMVFDDFKPTRRKIAPDSSSDAERTKYFAQTSALKKG
jgi:hypothetical protein